MFLKLFSKCGKSGGCGVPHTLKMSALCGVRVITISYLSFNIQLFMLIKFVQTFMLIKHLKNLTLIWKWLQIFRTTPKTAHGFVMISSNFLASYMFYCYMDLGRQISNLPG